MADELCFVQFPHPGREHRPHRNAWMDWNVQEHGRKFMRLAGKWRTSADLNAVEHEGEMVLWGEWEAPSQVVQTYKPLDRRWPHCLQIPFWQVPPDDGFLQNTDPYVFGDRFLYSNCRQNIGRRPRRTQRLAVGSLIVFGSRLAGEFVIDTVLVIADSQPMSAAAIKDLKGVDDVFKAVVCDVLYRADRLEMHNRLYAGATPADPTGRMFSFFPCRPAEEAKRGFPRPPIHLDGLINQDSWQNYKVTEFPSLQEVEELWFRLVGEILGQGLCLGVHAATPCYAEGVQPSAAASGHC